MENTTSSSKTLPQEDIIETQILTKLPLDSLARFKTVSKQWNSLISSTYFIKQHLQNLMKTSCVAWQLYTLELDPCYQTNPTNQTPKTISCSHIHNSYELNQNSFLIGSDDPTNAFQFKGPNCPKHTVLHSGFGYDSLSDDHKIVLIIKDKSSRPLGYIFTLKTKLWRKLDLSCLSPKFKDRFLVQSCYKVTSTLVNNTLHWVIGSLRLGLILLMFDLGLESFSIQPLSSNYGYDVYPILLVKFGDNCVLVGRGRETSMYQALGSTTTYVSRTQRHKTRYRGFDRYGLN